MTLDLRKANFESETIINISTSFAGVDLYLPEDVNLQIESSSFLVVWIVTKGQIKKVIQK